MGLYAANRELMMRFEVPAIEVRTVLFCGQYFVNQIPFFQSEPRSLLH